MDGDDLSRFLLGQSSAIRAMEASFRAMKWGEAEVRAFVGGVVSSGNRDKLVSEDVIAELDEAVAQKAGKGRVQKKKKSGDRGEVIRMKTRMSEEGRGYVRDLFLSHVALEFEDESRCNYSPHPIIKGVQHVMDALVIRLSSVSTKRVLEVGPNIATAVTRAHRCASYTAVSPVLDSLDAERFTTSMKVLGLRVGGGQVKREELPFVEEALKGATSQVFRRCTLQQFHGSVDVILSLHANYNIPLDDAVRAIHRTGAEKYMITMVNLQSLSDWYEGTSDRMFSGRVGRTEMLWQADRARDTVLFHFDKSTTRPYTHKLSVLMEYFRVPFREFDVGDKRYYMRKLGISNEVECAWSLEPVGYTRDTEPMGVHCRFSGDEKSVILTGCAVDMRYRKGDGARYQKVSVEVGRESFTRVLQDRLARGPGKIEEVLSYARTNRVNIIHNGVRVSCDRPIAVDMLSQFAVAVDSLAAQLERTADVDQPYVDACLRTGGWVVKGGLVSAGKGLARSVWRSLLVSMGEAAAVGVEDSVRVERRVTGSRVLSVFQDSSTTVCTRYRDALKLLVEQGANCTYEERRALAAYVEHLATVVCTCSTCRTAADVEESAEQFFDASEGTSETSSEAELIDSESGDSGVDMSADLEKMEMLIPAFSEAPEEKYTEGEARDAVEECVGIVKGRIAAAQDNARDVARRLKVANMGADALSMLDTERTRNWLVRVHPTGKILAVEGNVAEGEELTYLYDYGVDKFHAVRGDEFGDRWTEPGLSEWCYSNSCMNPWLYPAVLRTLETCLADPMFGKLPKRIPFLNGIWGSGKSYLAKQWFRERRRLGKEVYFLGSSRKPTEEVRKELFPGDVASGRKYVRTIGSFVQNGLDGRVDELVIDEVCMEHAAIIYAILWILKPEKFWVAGDWKQMGYVPFLAGCRPKHASLLEPSEIALLQKGHRVPFDVYAGGLKVYGRDSGIHPCDCPEHVREEEESLTICRVHSIVQVPAKKGVMYLTHGQGTKKRLLSHLKDKGLVEKEPGSLVATMAEFQGGTRGEIIIVRDVYPRKPGTLYHEIQRNNVGFSRSTGKTSYYSVSPEDDFLCDLIYASKDQGSLDTVKANAELGKDISFGLKELLAFIDGTLESSHPSLVAGFQLKANV